MKRGQAVKFWKALEDSTEVESVISAFENKKGYGGPRTLERYVQAYKGFKQQLPSEEVAQKTGWRSPYVDKIRTWFEGMSSSLSHKVIPFNMDKHRNDLLEVVVPELSGINVFDARNSELAIWYVRPHEPTWRIAKGQLERQHDGNLVIRLDVEEKLEWKYMRQHLENDELWTAINTWKEAMRHDIGLRLALLRQIVSRVESSTALQVSELGTAGEGSGIDIYYVYSIYDQVFCKAIGIRVAPIQRYQFVFDAPNTVRLGGQSVIRHAEADIRARAVDSFLDAQTSLADIPEVQRAKGAYEDARKKTEEVKRHISRIRLMVAFPKGSTCDGCREWVNPS